MTATPVSLSFSGRNTVSVGSVTPVTRLPVACSFAPVADAPGASPGQTFSVCGSAAKANGADSDNVNRRTHVVRFGFIGFPSGEMEESVRCRQPCCGQIDLRPRARAPLG